MRKMILVFILSGLAFSNDNPQRRICITNGALFWTYQIKSPVEDEVGFCQYGQALLDSMSLIEFFTQNVSSLAIQHFYSTSKKPYQSCEHASGISIDGQDSQGTTKTLCLFKDYSFISQETLTSGWYSSLGSELAISLSK